jgi:hypothetical protein
MDCNHASPAAEMMIADPDAVFRDLSTLQLFYKPALIKIVGAARHDKHGAIFVNSPSLSAGASKFSTTSNHSPELLSLTIPYTTVVSMNCEDL